jgi:phage gp29-like protein
MDTKLAAILSFIIFPALAGTTTHTIISIFEEANATGGAGEIKGLIDPIIDRAISALQNNNTELALEEIQTLKNELDDTFKTDKDEKEDD